MPQHRHPAPSPSPAGPRASRRRPAAKSVAELIGGALDPLVRKRGLARAELIAWWPDIVGAAYADKTAPERIRWPRDGSAATLTIRCDAAFALQLSYELEPIRSRLNGYFGYSAVGAIRLSSRPFTCRAEPRPALPERPLSTERKVRLAALQGPLANSLRRFGEAVLSST